MNIAPTFDKTLFNNNESKVNTSHWNTVLDHYDNHNYRDALIGVIDYVDSNIAKKYGNAEKTSFVIPHGSIVLELKIDNNQFSVTAPFLIIPDQNNITLLRQVAQINFSPLNLTNILLNGDQLVFSYFCPLELCEPYKTYNVLREVCVYADSYDDEFIKKFNAKRIKEPVITTYSQDQLDIAWGKVQSYIEEAEKYISYLENKRLFGFCWDILLITFMKIEYLVSPQGMLRTEIEKTISYMRNRDIAFNDTINAGKDFLRRLKEYDRREFDEDIYLAEVFIPYRYTANLESIRHELENSYKRAKKEMDSSDYIGATLTLQYAFMNLFYNNNFSKGIVDLVTYALTEANQKPWSNAARILWDTMDKIMQTNDFSIPQKKKKGFLGSLFGK